MLPWLYTGSCCCFAVLERAQRRCSLEQIRKRGGGSFFSCSVNVGSSLDASLLKWTGLHMEANREWRCFEQERPDGFLTSIPNGIFFLGPHGWKNNKNLKRCDLLGLFWPWVQFYEPKIIQTSDANLWTFLMHYLIYNKYCSLNLTKLKSLYI